MSDAADIGRLRWRCRRGTTELDRLLRWYVDARWLAADTARRAAFDALLDRQDPELWDWFSGAARSPDASLQDIVDEIRRDYRP